MTRSISLLSLLLFSSRVYAIEGDKGFYGEDPPPSFVGAEFIQPSRVYASSGGNGGFYGKGEGLKSVGKARLYSAILPGAGQFYIGNTLKGIMDLGIEGVLVTGTVIFIDKAGDAPNQSEADSLNVTSKEDYIGIAVITGVTALGYYIFQLWRLNDDVVAHNYKKLFLAPYSLNMGIKKDGFSLGATMTF